MTRRSSRLTVASILCTFTLSAALAAAPAQALDDPPFSVPTAALAAALHCPQTFTHPEHEPVLLVHGTALTFAESWSWNYAEALPADGYDVCGVDLPNLALGDIQEAAEYVVYAIQQIHAATGLSVDVVTHSQSALQARWAMKWWPSLHEQVDDIVMLAAPNHGALFPTLACVLPCSAAGSQGVYSSNFLTALNGGDETPGPASYTSIYTLLTDELVEPTSPPVTGATNVPIQSYCPARPVTHGGMLYDGYVYRLVLDALSHTGGAVPSRLPFGSCLTGAMPSVTATEVATQSVLVASLVVTRTAAAPSVTSEPPLRPYAS